MRMISLVILSTIFIIIIAIGNTGQCLPSGPCEKLSDLKIKLDGNLENVFAAPSWIGNSTRTAASNTEMTNIPVKIHLFLNTSEESHWRRLTQTQQWIDSENGSALVWAWMQIGLNFSNIKIMVYLPSTDSLNANISLRHISNITILNASQWKKLGERAIMLNKMACQSKTQISFTGTGTVYSTLITDNSCPSDINGTDTEYQYPCEDFLAQLESMCGHDLHPPFYVDQGDVFNYTIEPNTPYGNTTVKLFLMPLGEVVFESNEIEDTFQFKKGGVYKLLVKTDSTTNFSRQITFFINKKCTSIKDFIGNWIQSSGSLTTLEQVHVLLTINRIEPINYGVYEYLVHSPSKMPGVTVLIKNWSGTDSSIWAYLAEAFGAVIRKEDHHASCEQIKTALFNDTVVALRQAEKIRCSLYNSAEPFGKNFNRTLVNVRLADGMSVKLYIPRKFSNTNQILDCDEKKLCVFKNNTVMSSTTASIMATTTMSTTSKSSMVPSPRSTSKSSVVPSPRPTSIVPRPRPSDEWKIIFGFYDNDDISSLSNEDVSQWTWSNMKRGVNHYCVKKTSLKLTIPAEDVNQLSRDMVSLQYQRRNGKLYLDNHKVCWIHIVSTYNCEEEEIKSCPNGDGGLENWHIVSFTISGVIAIVDAILVICLCRICHEP